MDSYKFHEWLICSLPMQVRKSGRFSTYTLCFSSIEHTADRSGPQDCYLAFYQVIRLIYSRHDY